MGIGKIAYGTSARCHINKKDWLSHKQNNRTVLVYASDGETVMGECNVAHATDKAVLLERVDNGASGWWPMKALNWYPIHEEDSEQQVTFHVMAWFEAVKRD